MFINTSLFKKMVKNAYTGGGLSVARQRQKYVIAGNWWCLKVRADAFPAKAKAAVIELVSDFPREGEKFISYKREEKQWDMFNPTWENIAGEGYKVEKPEISIEPKPTCAYFQTTKGILRMWQEKEGRILFAPAQLDGLVGGEFIDKTIETIQSRPICLCPEQSASDVLYWYNNCCELWISCARLVRKTDDTVDADITEKLGNIKWQQSLKIEL